MVKLLSSPSFLPSCILAGVGIIFVVLAATLPPVQVFGLVGGSAVALGLAVARLRRDSPMSGASARLKAKH